MTKAEEETILNSPCTRKLVHDVLRLAEKRDILDAAHDIELAAEILKARFQRMVDDVAATNAALGYCT